MGYYDSVKDSVRENNKKNTGSAGGGNFDTLKEKAEETADDENRGDDTPIEVLEEDGLSQESPNQQKQESSSQTKKSENPLTSNSSASSSSGSGDMSGVEDKLDKLIEQNQRMIEILESFGQ